MPIQKSYKNKLVDFGIDTGTFKGDDGRDIAYTTVAIELEVDGNIEKINLSGASAPKPSLLGLVLRSAQDNDTSKGLLGE